MASLIDLDDKAAAAAFRRLVRHLRHRSDATNIDLMGHAGFCRNCLADWIHEASAEQGNAIGKESAREMIYGMPYSEWKASHHGDATPEQIARMEASVARNRKEEDALDEALDESFPASDPPSMTEPNR